VFVVFFTEEWPAEHLTTVYQLVIILLSVIFVERENRRFQHVYHPYELGLLIWIFWPVFLPYYLVKTRGKIGILMFGGLIAILLVQSAVFLVWDVLYAQS
jgi:glucose dehydrogenase